MERRRQQRSRTAPRPISQQAVEACTVGSVVGTQPTVRQLVLGGFVLLVARHTRQFRWERIEWQRVISAERKPAELYGGLRRTVVTRLLERLFGADESWQSKGARL